MPAAIPPDSSEVTRGGGEAGDGARGPLSPSDTVARLSHDEHGLVERLREGDQAAYEQLVRQYGGAMLALARRFLHHEDDARDAVQDAFVSTFQAIHRFRESSSLATWLHRIVVNAALVKLRRRTRRSEVSIEELLPVFDEQGHHAAVVGAWPMTIEALVLVEETRGRVRECIGRLPAKFRAVLILRDLEELTTAEAAHLLATTENAVKVRLHRARQALATLLRDVLSPSERDRDVISVTLSATGHLNQAADRLTPRYPARPFRGPRTHSLTSGGTRT